MELKFREFFKGTSFGNLYPGNEFRYENDNYEN